MHNTEPAQAPPAVKRIHIVLPQTLWQACAARSEELDLDLSQYVRHLMRADLKAAKEETK